jgi:hypothetical protein
MRCAVFFCCFPACGNAGVVVLLTVPVFFCVASPVLVFALSIVTVVTISSFRGRKTVNTKDKNKKKGKRNTHNTHK